MAQKYVHVHSPGEPVGRIKFNGIFDMDGMYRLMHDWLVDRGYYLEEWKYKHKVPSPAGAEQTINWSAWRNVNIYVKYWIDIYFKIRDIKEIDVIKEGKKKRLTKARMLIEFSGKVELDYSKRFGGSRFGVLLMDFYNKYILKPEKIISQYWDELYYRVYKLHRVVKEYLDMESKGNAYYDMW